MPDEHKTKPGEQAPAGGGSPVEKKEKPLVEETTPKNEKVEGEEEVKVSKKELDTLKKDSNDLHGIYDARKKAKLNKPKEDQPGAPAPGEAPAEEQPAELENRLTTLEKDNEETKTQNQKIFKSNLDKAYARIKEAHPWAIKGEAIEAIRKNLDYGNAITEDEIFAKLNSSIQQTFPDKYQKSLEENAKKKAIMETDKINAGDMPAGGSPPMAATDQKDAKLEATQQRLDIGLPPGFSSAKKE